MVHNLLKNYLPSEVNDYARLFKSLISIEQNILINHDRDFVKKIKEFINSFYDPNNLSIEDAERLLNKNISFYLNEKNSIIFLVLKIRRPTMRNSLHLKK